MFPRIVLIPAVTAITVLGCAPAPEDVPQEEAAQQETIPVDLAGAAVESMKDELLAPAAEEEIPEGWERGNLSESGVSELLTESDWLRAVEASKEEPVLIFKHSTECSVSGGAYRRLASYLKDRGESAPKTYLVKVIERRPVSKKIEADMKVTHESPQTLLLDDGKAIWNTSHEAITAESLHKAIDAVSQESNG